MINLKEENTPCCELLHGDCLKELKKIADKSVDMICTDLPYGKQTKNKWDVAIPFEPLWKQYNRIIKDNGAIVLFANGMFTADLMKSNPKMWRYNLIWDKVVGGGFLNANKMPLRSHEDICVFYKSPPTYNPQKTKGKPNHSRGKGNSDVNNNYGNYGFVDNHEKLGDMKHPLSIISVQKDHPCVMRHPTQKPVELYCWLIKTYTNEGDVVLDSCFGSGNSGIAALELSRKYIGIELDNEYFEKGAELIEKHKKYYYPQELFNEEAIENLAKIFAEVEEEMQEN